MLTMNCDWDGCGARVPENVNGSCRLKLGTREFSFHLCETHKETLLDELNDSLVESIEKYDAKRKRAEVEG